MEEAEEVELGGEEFWKSVAGWKVDLRVETGEEDGGGGGIEGDTCERGSS